MNLNQITIPSKDVATSVEFYKKLGLKLIVDSSPRYVRFECPNGESTFSIHEVTKLPTNEGEGIWIYFECENLDEHVKNLQNQGIFFDETPNDKVWEWREARLKDPDNHTLILFYAGDNRKNPAWRVK